MKKFEHVAIFHYQLRFFYMISEFEFSVRILATPQINNILTFVYISSLSAIQIKNRCPCLRSGEPLHKAGWSSTVFDEDFFLGKKNKINESGFVFRGYMCNSFHASNLQLRDMTTCRIIWSDGLFFLLIFLPVFSTFQLYRCSGDGTVLPSVLHGL